MFGVSSVKDDQEIDLVIKLKDWSKDQEYDRMGLEDEYTEYLGNKVVSQTRSKSCSYLRVCCCKPQAEEDGLQCC